MAIQDRVGLLNDTRMALADASLQQVPLAIIATAAFGGVVRNLRHLIWPTLALVGIITACIPEAIDLDRVDRASRATAPPLAHADVGAWFSFNNYTVGGCRVEHGIIIVIEESIVVARADC